MNDITAYEVLNGVLTVIDTPFWNYNRSAFHHFFATRQKDFASILAELSFYSGINGKHCPDLEQALSDLRAQGILQSWGTLFNPQEYVPSAFSRSLVDHYFPEQTYRRQRLCELAKEFQAKFGSSTI